MDESDELTIIMKYFSMPFSMIDESCRKKVNNIVSLKSTTNNLYLMNTYGVLHPQIRNTHSLQALMTYLHNLPHTKL